MCRLGRVGSVSICVPERIAVEVNGPEVVFDCQGKRRALTMPRGLLCEYRDSKLFVVSSGKVGVKSLASIAGLYRSLLNGIVEGLVKGFSETLLIVGVGYRASIDAKNKYLTVSLGYSHLIKYRIPGEVVIECPKQTELLIKSFDKAMLGSVVADLCSLRKYDPYKGKGIVVKGRFMLRKEASKK